jgi:pyridoxine 4-dehydrogenase
LAPAFSPMDGPSASEPIARRACAGCASTRSTSGSFTSPTPAVPLDEQLGAIRELRDEGKVRFVGVSNVSVEQLRRARELIEIATVQNRFNVAEQRADDVLRTCEAEGIGFMPFAPIAMGGLADASTGLAGAAGRNGATPAQVALAWLLQRSPVLLPIPGTGSLEHLRENVDAALLARVSA